MGCPAATLGQCSVRGVRQPRDCSEGVYFLVGWRRAGCCAPIFCWSWTPPRAAGTGWAWNALWLEVERDGTAHVPYSMALRFTQKVICAIRDLLTGARVPVEVSKGIWVPQKKTGGTWHQD